MALIPGYINSSGGAPSYDAAGLRMLDSHDLTPDGASSALTSRQGVRPSSVEGLKVTNSAFTYNVAPGYAVVSKSSQGALGDYRVANSTVVSGTIPAAHATYARKDLVWLRVRDHDVDGSGVRTADVYYQQGTASAVPVDPTPAPAGALLLARIDVPVSGGGNPTVTDLRVYTVASGGIVPAASDPATPHEGQVAYRTDTDTLRVYTGSSWRHVAGGNDPTAARAYATATTGLGTTGAAQLIALAGETYDYGNNFSGNTYTVPRSGLLFVSGRVSTAGSASGDRLLVSVFVNGAEVMRGTDVTSPNVNPLSGTVSGDLPVNQGDLVTLRAGLVASVSKGCDVGSIMTYLSCRMVA